MLNTNAVFLLLTHTEMSVCREGEGAEGVERGGRQKVYFSSAFIVKLRLPSLGRAGLAEVGHPLSRMPCVTLRLLPIVALRKFPGL